ncbi:RNA-guided endonuclease InsQ/TnpB family protein, partial [Streptomyces carpinensis]|uniref:RNA-guided endonuclease InsQ/TnpB family protein n=1 Tax=Streptomyces carpinensis TaxID=66369 RepID=UPI000A3CB242
MTPVVTTEGAGHARYSFRVRLSATARRALEAEWDRCRWLWNECVAKSKQVHQQSKESGEKLACGPAQLDRMLTEARRVTPWLAAGASVPQQQVIRDFARSRAKALKDIKDGLPVHRRAGMPRWKRKREARPSLNYTKRGFRLKDGRVHLAGQIVVRVVWSRDLPAEPSSVRVYQDTLGHWYVSFVAPAQVEPLVETGRVLGVDWGVKETAVTTDDAYDLPHAEHGKRAAQGLARYQRMMARRRSPKGRPASKGYRKAQVQAAKLHRKVAGQREDTS